MVTSSVPALGTVAVIRAPERARGPRRFRREIRGDVIRRRSARVSVDVASGVGVVVGTGIGAATTWVSESELGSVLKSPL